MDKVESELIKFGFIKNRSTNWSRKHEIVQILRSSEHPKIRVTWREYWKDFLALIFDYSSNGGPICIVPAKEFFNQPFVSQKRTEISYANSRYYWSQLFAFNDGLSQFILGFENRWDILGGEQEEKKGWPASSEQHPIQKFPNHPSNPSIPDPSTTTVQPATFGGMLEAFSDKHLLHLYCDLMEELRLRNIVRSGNNPVSDYGEKIVAQKLNLQLTVGSNKGYDAIDPQNGIKYQIKSRRVTKHNGSRQLGVIRNLDERPFDYLVAVIFNQYLVPNEIWQISIDIIPKYAKFSKHQNGHILVLSGEILQEKTAINLSEKL